MCPFFISEKGDEVAVLITENSILMTYSNFAKIFVVLVLLGCFLVMKFCMNYLNWLCGVGLCLVVSWL